MIFLFKTVCTIDNPLWISPLRLNCSETISHREKSEVGNETLDLGLQDISILFCYNLITFDSAAHLKWTNPTEKIGLAHLWNETLELCLVQQFFVIKSSVVW